MIVALLVFLCVIGAFFLLPCVAVLVLFFLRKNSIINAGFSDDLRSVMNKFMRDLHERTQHNMHADERRGSEISRREALEILGLGDNANKEQIISAYHRLMKCTHPDKGGTAYFAQKLNQARDKLLVSKSS